MHLRVLIVGIEPVQRFARLLGDELDVQGVADIDEAVLAVGHGLFAAVLVSCTAGHIASPECERLSDLRATAAPTPVGVVLDASVPAMLGRGFAFVLVDPSDAELLSAVRDAVSLQLLPTSPEVTLLRRYFTALAQQDWAGLGSLCAEDVVYHLPVPGPFGRMVVGRDAFVAYAREVFPRFTEAKFDPVAVYELSRGYVVRYLGSWLGADGARQAQAGSVEFRLKDGLISRIGVDLDHKRLEEAAGEPARAAFGTSGLNELLQARLRDLVAKHAITARETEVLDLVVLGRSTPEIAAVLGISPRTAKFHVTNVLKKIGADSRKDLLRSLL